MICQKKNKKLLVFCLSFLLFCLAVIPCLFCVDSYASETTTQTVDDYFREHNFYETCAFVCRKYASFPYTDYLTGASSGIIYDNFADYLESKGKSNLLQEDVIVTGTGGGRGYDIPQEVRQEMVNFVNEIYIQENPLSYVPCYIPSYNMLNSDYFYTYQSFVAVKEFIRQSGCYCYLSHNNVNNSTRKFYIITIPTNVNYGLYGTVTNGIFTNVNGIYNWQATTQPFNLSLGLKFYTCNPDGTISETEVAQGNIRSLSNIANVPSNTALSQNWVIISPLPRNETVYVFNTVDAYKRFNSGNPQPYYLPSNSQLTVPYYDGLTQSDLNNAGNFYNNIVVNTSGDNPNDIRKETDSILGSLDGIIGGPDSESSSGGLFDSLGDIITGATGAISPIKEIVLGDIKELVADVFDFLPPTIITLWVSGIIFGIFFGVLKLIRG